MAAMTPSVGRRCSGDEASCTYDSEWLLGGKAAVGKREMHLNPLDSDGGNTTGSRQLVSVIVPAYNRGAKAARAVRSALAQTYKCIEVIVVDDGSTDDTLDQIMGLGDERVHYVWQENAGLPAARNRGMAEARGDYLAFLDSDDTWLPWKIEGQLAALAAFPGAGMVWADLAAVDERQRVVHDRYLRTMYTAYFYIDWDRQFPKRRQLGGIWPACPADLSGTVCYSGDVYDGMFMGNLAHDSTVLMTRELQQATGEFDLAFEAGYEYFLRAAGHGDVVFMDAVSVNYQIGADDQLSAPDRLVIAARHTMAAIEKELAGNAASARVPERLVRERMALCHAWLGEEEMPEDRRLARRHLRAALSNGPFLDRKAWRRTLLWYAASFLPDGTRGTLRQTRRNLLALLRRNA